MLADFLVRQESFMWLDAQRAIYGDALPREILQEGFLLEGERIRLVGPQGIFKPKCMELPLSITTVSSGPYADSFTYEGLLLYRYRGTDPDHRDNVGLRRAMAESRPLVYFHQIMKGMYVPAWPVFIVGDDRARLTFSVAVDEGRKGIIPPFVGVGEQRQDQLEEHFRRAYATRNFRQRLHQSSFRERVLQAYHEQCAFCRLRHRELLDAAHILPDTDPEGEPIVSNGLSLCKLHHAAFDRHFVGIRDDYRIEVRPDILKETDGPMLVHGLQALHGRRIILPRQSALRPNGDFLQKRYALFKEAV